MAKQRHLANAPITEAVIDLRVKISSTLNLESFSKLPPELETIYPTKEPITKFEVSTVIDRSSKEAPKNESKQEHIGYRHISSDSKYIAQFRKDGFTFSRLAPYTNWDLVFADAKRMLQLYLEIGCIEEINRIAVRYINLMPLPRDKVTDFATFLSLPPRFPTTVPSFLTSFLTQTSILERDSGIQTTVTQAVHPQPTTPDKIPVILDVDVFHSGNFPLNLDFLLQEFTTLRNIKNQVFFDSITEETANLFS